jgi:TolA-binding protein
MNKFILILLFICCTALTACTNDQGAQQLEIAQFEEKQNNREHAIKLYEEVVSKYAGTPNAKFAQERLNALKEGK